MVSFSGNSRYHGTFVRESFPSPFVSLLKKEAAFYHACRPQKQTKGVTRKKTQNVCLASVGLEFEAMHHSCSCHEYVLVPSSLLLPPQDVLMLFRTCLTRRHPCGLKLEPCATRHRMHPPLGVPFGAFSSACHLSPHITGGTPAPELLLFFISTSAYSTHPDGTLPT